MSENIGFLGLGNLGLPIAMNLLDSGAALTVHNRTASKAAPLVAKGARLARTPREAVPRNGVVFSILWDDASLEELVASEGFLDAIGLNGVHVSMTTVTPATSRKVAALHADLGIAFVEAPVFGIPAQAVAKTMIVCLTGPAAAKARIAPLLTAMGAAKTFDFGEAIGAATATKLAGNFMIISGFVAMKEVFDVLRANEIDPKATLEMLTTTLVATPGNQRYAGYLLSGQTGMASGIPQKDVGLFSQFGKAGNLDTPVAATLAAQIEKARTA